MTNAKKLKFAEFDHREEIREKESTKKGGMASKKELKFHIAEEFPDLLDGRKDRNANKH